MRSIARRLDLPEHPLEAVALIRSIAVFISHLEAAHWARIGLSPAAGWVLIELALEGSARPTDLAASFLVTAGGMSQVVSSLERRRLVEKKRDPLDRRALTVALTPRGRKLIETELPMLAETLARIEMSLGGARLRALSVTLREFLEALQLLGE